MTAPLATLEPLSRPARRGVLEGLRLLIVADSATTHTHRWAHWASESGAHVTILSIHPDPVAGATVEHFPRPRWYHRIPKVRMLLDLIPFRRLLRRIDPQLIHFHFVSEGGRAFYWDSVNVPMVASTWGQDVIFDTGPNPRLERGLRRILSRCDQLTATTWQLAAATAAHTPPRKPIHVIPFGVDLDRFAPRPFPPQSIVTFGFVKHLLPKYGPDVLIEAFAIVHRERPHTRLVLAGRGGMHEALSRRISDLGLDDAVRIVGRVPHEHVPDLVRSFDVMVMPSIYESETFGVAAIEASACAVPNIASRIGGVPEAVIHDETGLLVPPRDVDALAQACIRLADDAALRRTMGLAGRRFVERYYDWRSNTQLMEEIYRAALDGDSPRDVPVYQPGHAPTLVVPD